MPFAFGFTKKPNNFRLRQFYNNGFLRLYFSKYRTHISCECDYIILDEMLTL
jgi:hypothetical protein